MVIGTSVERSMMIWYPIGKIGGRLFVGRNEGFIFLGFVKATDRDCSAVRCFKFIVDSVAPGVGRKRTVRRDSGWLGTDRVSFRVLLLLLIVAIRAIECSLANWIECGSPAPVTHRISLGAFQRWKSHTPESVYRPHSQLV
jgi:hypothetical protein